MGRGNAVVRQCEEKRRPGSLSALRCMRGWRGTWRSDPSSQSVHATDIDIVHRRAAGGHAKFRRVCVVALPWIPSRVRPRGPRTHQGWPARSASTTRSKRRRGNLSPSPALIPSWVTIMGESLEDGEFMRPAIGPIGNFHLTGKCSSRSQTAISPLDAPILDGQ
jgi:hypothetical protein